MYWKASVFGMGWGIGIKEKKESLKFNQLLNIEKKRKERKKKRRRNRRRKKKKPYSFEVRSNILTRNMVVSAKY